MISAAAIKYRLAWHLPSEVEVSIDVLTKYKLVIFLKQGKTSRLRDHCLNKLFALSLNPELKFSHCPKEELYNRCLSEYGIRNQVRLFQNYKCLSVFPHFHAIRLSSPFIISYRDLKRSRCEEIRMRLIDKRRSERERGTG